MNLTYTQVNGYNIPDLALPPQPEGELNRWGRARRDYLLNHKKGLHLHMMTQGLLWPHLLETQETAAARFDLLITQMAEAQGVDEALKARDQMLWIGRMGNIRQQAEELVRQELIYS
ncbi:MAG: TnpV protein [Firmicutes bacterium]|nr:TnpV protein [Bacillota bacterium]